MSHENEKPDELELKMMDYLAGHMTPKEQAAFNEAIANDPQLSQELTELQQMMDIVGQHDESDIPTPSTQMDQNFYDMLNQEISQQESLVEQNQTGMWSVIMSWVQLPQVRKLAYGFSFMVVGVFLGHYIHLVNEQNDITTERLALKDQQIQALTVLSLLDMPSANKRLMAVNLVRMDEMPSQQVVNALLTTLKEDSNVNVRLEALDVLAKHAAHENIRSGLVAAIKQQNSPMVQIAMANLMLQINETEAVQPINDLLNQTDLIEPVREQLTETIKELI
ncbi:MAG: HEAT repeat domain-containing protein [Marinicella sp.]